MSYQAPLQRLARPFTALAIGLSMAGAHFGAQAAVNINAKVYLQGALTNNALPMRTQLRTSTAFPLTDPYGVGITALSVPLTAVDWVKVELLAGASAAACAPVQTTAGFLLADGSIVAADGGPLNIAAATPGTYNLRISHRNHGALISTPAVFSAAGSALVDLTVNANVANPGNIAATPVGLVAALGGDANGDGVVNYTGAGTDEAALQAALGGNLGGILTNQYAREDMNLNGTIRYSGPTNDESFLTASALGGDTNAVINIPSAFPTTGAVCAAPVATAGVQPVPTLSPGMLAGLSALLAAAGGALAKRRRRGDQGA